MDYTVFYNAVCEAEAQALMAVPFVKTVAICAALAELYRFGMSQRLPGLITEQDYEKAASWQLQALSFGDTFGFTDCVFMSHAYQAAMTAFLQAEDEKFNDMMFWEETYPVALELQQREFLYETGQC